MSMFIKKKKPPEVLNEVYFGETKGIKKIQEQISKLRKTYLDNVYDFSINTDPELYKLNSLFEEQFGFSCFSLIIDNTISVNACTMPVGFYLDTNLNDDYKSMISSKEGFKFSKQMDYAGVVIIYSGLMCDSRYTDREVMAIILHEIGHNFAHVVSSKIFTFSSLIQQYNRILVILQVLSVVCAPLAIRTYYDQTNAGVKAIKNLKDRVKKGSPKIYNSFLALNTSVKFVLDMFGEYMFVMNIFSPLNNIIVTPIILARYAAQKVKSWVMAPAEFLMFITGFGYKHEQFSDSFAAIYGYGPDLTSALEKISLRPAGHLVLSEQLAKTPLISHLYDLTYSIPVEIVVNIFDEHPTYLARIQTQIEILEAEYNKTGISPEMRKRIKSDIDKINAKKQEIEEYHKDITDPNILKKIFYAYFVTEGGGIKYKILKDSVLAQDIDNAYIRGKK